MSVFYLPFIIQGLLMGIDERIHLRRGLGRWERLGHPLDSLTVFVPLSFIALNKFSNDHLIVFMILSVFSCLFVTKDEFVHRKECDLLESWLHALLYIFHPIVFTTSALLWKFYPEDPFIHYQPIIVGLFMVYQILKWSIPWKFSQK